MLRYGMMSVFLKETGEYAGWVTLTEPLFLPEILPAVEIGWRFRRARCHFRPERPIAFPPSAAAENDGVPTIAVDEIDLY